MGHNEDQGREGGGTWGSSTFKCHGKRCTVLYATRAISCACYAGTKTGISSPLVEGLCDVRCLHTTVFPADARLECTSSHSTGERHWTLSAEARSYQSYAKQEHGDNVVLCNVKAGSQLLNLNCRAQSRFNRADKHTLCAIFLFRIR